MTEFLSRLRAQLDVAGWPLAELAAIIVAAALALLAHALLYRIARRAAFRDRDAPSWVSKSRPATRLILVAFALLLALPAVALEPGMLEAIRRMVRLLMIAGAGWLALVVLWATTDAAMARRRIDVEDNLEARKYRTRMRILRQAVAALIILVAAGAMLVTFPAVRAIGLSLFASAGVAGVVVGFAAQPILSNLIAGVQIALTQPIRVDDAVVVEDEWGWIEEIGSTYVVIRLWDLRRLVVPLSYFIQKPFQNWTRESAAIIGSVFWHVDYRAPVDLIRRKLAELLRDAPLWDGKVQNLQVVECDSDTIKLRALMSARNSPNAWDLRCQIREKMIAWLNAEHPDALPRARIEFEQSAAFLQERPS